METNELINLISETGVTIFIIAYFVYRDLKFMSTLQTTLTTLVDTVNVLKDTVKEVTDHE